MNNSMSEILEKVPHDINKDPESSGRMARVFELQGKRALDLRETGAGARIEKLKLLRRAIMLNRSAIVAAAAQDFGRSETETEFTELLPVMMEISDHCRHLKKWLKPKKVRSTMMMFGTRGYTRYEPRGRCLIIAPWNYPVTLTLGPLVPAIASGNTVMIKTSEIAPNFSRVLVKVVEQCFDESEVAIFEGDASVSEALLKLPFDHCFFTGSPEIGKLVMGAASQHLCSVTLELGGKSPVIVDATADISLAAKTICWAKYINNGQTCIAPDHIYVESSVKDRFVGEVRKNLDRWYGDGEVKLSRVVNRRHTERIIGLLDDAKEKDGEVLYGGEVDAERNFVSPTVLGNVSEEARINKEEIFGPLLPIIEFDNVNDVIKRINKDPKPLALYIWSRDKDRSDGFINKTSTGAVCVNHVAAHFLHHNLPFGGVNNSGMGSYHGEWGIKAFSHEKSILKTRFLVARVFFPPYGAGIKKAIRFLVGFV